MWTSLHTTQSLYYLIHSSMLVKILKYVLALNQVYNLLTFWKNYHPVIPSKAVKVGVIAWASPWFLYTSVFQGSGKTINQSVSHQITWIQIPGQLIFFLRNYWFNSHSVSMTPLDRGLALTFKCDYPGVVQFPCVGYSHITEQFSNTT